MPTRDVEPQGGDIEISTADGAPRVVSVVASPRPRGNTHYVTELVTAELERRGIECRTLSLHEYNIEPCREQVEPGTPGTCPPQDDAETVYDLVYAADGLILASPVYFANVSAQMKAFMDRTNLRFLHGPPLAPRAVGLVAVGGQGGLKATVEAMQRFLDISCPHPPYVASVTGVAEGPGEVEGSDEVRRAARQMAGRVADILLTGPEQDAR
jgi:multimeric flavodoxin WrbA